MRADGKRRPLIWKGASKINTFVSCLSAAVRPKMQKRALYPLKFRNLQIELNKNTRTSLAIKIQLNFTLNDQNRKSSLR